VILLGLAAVLLLVNAVLVVRIEEFARPCSTGSSLALLAYVVIAGILEYVFIYDHTPGRGARPLSANARALRPGRPTDAVVLGGPLAAARRHLTLDITRPLTPAGP